MDIEKERMKFEALKEEKERLSKRVKFDIESTHAKLMGEFDKLNEKRKLLEADKKIITVAINRLDNMRSRTIDNCFKTVNKNFGKVFSTFLPGSDARLQLLKNNMEIDQGILIEFAFNGVWKSNLSELSGGQRSLLALSYMLAMLLYKPAPFYILDEIDAALDLSHTENLGVIFSKHFAQSQFVLITLKEELYKHANTLFKVYLKHGHSEIERLVSKSGKFSNPEDDERRLMGQLE
jgi:structural maintenance of chromosome 2